MTSTSEHLNSQDLPDIHVVNQDDHLDSWGDNHYGRSLGANVVYNDFWYSDDAISDYVGERSKSFKKHLKDARDVIENFSDEETKVINGILNDDQQSSWVRQRLQSSVEGMNEVGERSSLEDDVDFVRIIRSKNENGEYRVDDTTFLHFLQWHQHAIAAEQAEFNKNRELTTRDFEERINSAIEKGWMPEWVSRRLDERLTNVTYVIDDGMRTQIVPKNSMGGYTLRSDDGKLMPVVLEPEELSVAHGNRRDKIITHELIHVIDGYVEDGNERGLPRLFSPTSNWGPTALNEAVVEHLADSIYYDIDIDTIDPSVRSHKADAYHNERTLLHTLCNNGKKTIDVRLFIAAHFQHEETDTYDGELPLELLKTEIENAFPGMNVLQRIQDIKENADVGTFVDALRSELGVSNITRQSRNRNRLAKVAAAGVLIDGVVGLGLVGISAHQSDNKIEAPTVTVVDYEYDTADQVLNDSANMQSDSNTEIPSETRPGINEIPSEYPYNTEENGGYSITVPLEQPGTIQTK